eukprot:SAG31_NODE_3015_length_4786_cov_2.418818_4_plen_297_part_01
MPGVRQKVFAVNSFNNMQPGSLGNTNYAGQLRRRNAGIQQLTTPAEQIQRDERLWEEEAQRWLQEQEAKANHSSNTSSGIGQTRLSGAEAPDSATRETPKLRYLARKPQLCAFPPLVTSLENEDTNSSRAASTCHDQPKFPPLLAIDNVVVGNHTADEADSSLADAAPEPERLSSYTLMVSCDDAEVLKGAHKIRVLNEPTEVYDVPSFQRSVWAVLGRHGVLLVPLEPLLASAPSTYSVQYWDVEFQEYVVLHALNELPASGRAKIKLVHRAFNSRPNTAELHAELEASRLDTPPE